MYLKKILNAVFYVVILINSITVVNTQNDIDEDTSIWKPADHKHIYGKTNTKHNLADALSKILKEYKLNGRNTDEFNGQDDFYGQLEEPGNLKPFKNKVIVKRLLPHGYKSTNQYDYKYNTYYKPLFKLIGGKPFKNVENGKHRSDNSVPIENLAKLLKRYPSKRIKNSEVNNPRSKGNFEIANRGSKMGLDDELLQPFQVGKPRSRKVTFRSILDDIQSYLTTLDSKSEARRLKYAVLNIVENFTPKAKLRFMPTRSEEKEIPGLKQLHEEIKKDKEKKVEKKKWLTYYPFWNYWTYEKRLYQDRCPGGLVKISDTCIETPPH